MNMIQTGSHATQVNNSDKSLKASNMEDTLEDSDTSLEVSTHTGKIRLEGARHR